MGEQKRLSHPVDAYKAIIDQLVGETSYGVSEKLVSQEGTLSRLPANEEFNSFVHSLSSDQKNALAKMLHVERTAAIHDVLAVFSWWIQTGGLSFTIRGESMPVDLSGMGLNGDYIGRQNGWDWPED